MSIYLLASTAQTATPGFWLGILSGFVASLAAAATVGIVVFEWRLGIKTVLKFSELDKLARHRLRSLSDTQFEVFRDQEFIDVCPFPRNGTRNDDFYDIYEKKAEACSERMYIVGEGIPGTSAADREKMDRVVDKLKRQLSMNEYLHVTRVQTTRDITRYWQQRLGEMLLVDSARFRLFFAPTQVAYAFTSDPENETTCCTEMMIPVGHPSVEQHEIAGCGLFVNNDRRQALYLEG